MADRLCVGCGRPLVIKPGESPSRFRDRRACDRICRDNGYTHRLPKDLEQWWAIRKAWVEDTRFDDDPVEAARPHCPVRLARPTPTISAASDSTTGWESSMFSWDIR